MLHWTLGCPLLADTHCSNPTPHGIKHNHIHNVGVERAGHRAACRAACRAGCSSKVKETWARKGVGPLGGQGKAGQAGAGQGQGRPDDRAPASSSCPSAQLRGVFSPQVSQGATQQVVQEAHAVALIVQPYIHHAGTAKQHQMSPANPGLAAIMQCTQRSKYVDCDPNTPLYS